MMGVASKSQQPAAKKKKKLQKNTPYEYGQYGNMGI